MSAKFLFDQNLSPKRVELLTDLYPNSDHLDLTGFGTDATLVFGNTQDSMISSLLRKTRILRI